MVILYDLETTYMHAYMMKTEGDLLELHYNKSYLGQLCCHKGKNELSLHRKMHRQMTSHILIAVHSDLTHSITASTVALIYVFFYISYLSLGETRHSPTMN